MASYIFFLYAKRLGYFFLDAYGVLRWRPDDYLVPSNIRHSHGRFHGSVGEMGREVRCFHDLSTFAEFGIYVADVAHHFGRFMSCGEQFFLVVGRSVGSIVTVLPFDFQLLASLKCGKGVVRDYSHSTQRLKGMRRLEGINRNCLFNSDDLQRGFVVAGLDLSTENRGMSYRRIEHVVDTHVHAEEWLAGANVRDIHALGWLSDVAPRLGRLQLQLFFFGNGEFCRKCSEFSVLHFAI